MLKLKPYEACPKTSICPYSQSCHGVFASRATTFTCEYVDDRGHIRENCTRAMSNSTGNMKVLCE